ncbi:UPF0193 protein EVG1 isoform X1 [Erpetoichthys calabaricus]|uniref:UPF0193 protein EVG1 isoform X1 n=1 Tax=Erpetoichthys calabaricus TaxID=27687 RepID=UPI002234C5AE|nr:UPF0193 protein EVG1 isoform X1 [Erpetoichthys calabaricus]
MATESASLVFREMMSDKKKNEKMPEPGTGLWNSARPQPYSKETVDLLKVMMQESRLTNFQQRQLGEKLKAGGALPLKCNPTSSTFQKSTPPMSSKPHSVANLNGKPSRRSAERCQEGNAYEREKFYPKPTRDREKEKQRLQSILATGKETSEIEHRKCRDSRESDSEPERDRFDEVFEEIRERHAFLKEMELLGQGKQYQAIIATEISQKIRELEIIDKVRSSELLTMDDGQQLLKSI